MLKSRRDGLPRRGDRAAKLGGEMCGGLAGDGWRVGDVIYLWAGLQLLDEVVGDARGRWAAGAG